VKTTFLSCLLLASVPVLSIAAPPDFDGLTTPAAETGTSQAVSSGRLVKTWEGRFYRYDGNVLFGEIAKEAYGDTSLWYLIFRQNQKLLEPGSTEGVQGRELLLKIPEPPEKRIYFAGGKNQLHAIPGDTLMTISQRLYGSSKYWRGLYSANRDRLPNPDNPFVLFPPGTGAELNLVVPSEEEARTLTLAYDQQFGRQDSGEVTGPAAPISSFDEQREAAAPGHQPLPSSDPAPEIASPIASVTSSGPAGPSNSNLSSATDSQAFRKTGNPIANLSLTSASQIGEREAMLILQGTGMTKPNESLASGLKKLTHGYTYRRGGGTLDANAKKRLFREYALLKAALNRWSNYPNIGNKSTPQMVEKWMREASKRLTAVPEGQRYRLLKSLMVQESSLTHWRNFKPTVGSAGDTGFGQFLPATARACGINPYDPEQNVYGIATYLNKLVRSKKGNVTEALASYNGGNHPPASSYRYAAQIQNRAKSL
jgi:hypothetical protein